MLGAAYFYYNRTKNVETQLEYELADVRSVASVTDYQRATEELRQS